MLLERKVSGASVNAGVCLISKKGEGGTDIQVKRAVAAVMQGRLYMSSAMAA